MRRRVEKIDLLVCSKINGPYFKNQMDLHFRKTSLNHKTQMPPPPPKTKYTYKKNLNVESLSLWWKYAELYSRGQWVLMEWVNPFSKEMVSAHISKYKFTGRQSHKEKLKTKETMSMSDPMGLQQSPFGKWRKWLFISSKSEH